LFEKPEKEIVRGKKTSTQDKTEGGLANGERVDSAVTEVMKDLVESCLARRQDEDKITAQVIDRNVDSHPDIAFQDEITGQINARNVEVHPDHDVSVPDGVNESLSQQRQRCSSETSDKNDVSWRCFKDRTCSLWQRLLHKGTSEDEQRKEGKTSTHQDCTEAAEKVRLLGLVVVMTIRV
jgi:hypothetical protein